MCNKIIIDLYVTETSFLAGHALRNIRMTCCCTLTFRILHFKVYDILKCKIFLIGFLNGLGNFKQTVKLHFTAMDPFYFFENSNFKPYTQFLLPLEHGKH